MRGAVAAARAVAIERRGAAVAVAMVAARAMAICEGRWRLRGAVAARAVAARGGGGCEGDGDCEGDGGCEGDGASPRAPGRCSRKAVSWVACTQYHAMCDYRRGEDK